MELTNTHTHTYVSKLYEEILCKLLFYHSIICEERGETNAASKIKLKD